MQIDAAVNHGNSGGPTFNLEGDVVGVNTAIYSPSGGNVGIAFAVPADTVKRVIEQLEKGGAVSRGWLGVKIQDVDKDTRRQASASRSPRRLISEVLTDGPAADAGLKIEDAIVQINGKKIDDSRDLARTIADLPAKSTVDVKIWRNKNEQTLKVKLGTYPNKDEVADKDNDQEDKPEDTSATVDLKQLGITLKPATGTTKEGVVISEVDPNSDAAHEGPASEGDVILKVGGENVTSPAGRGQRREEDQGRGSLCGDVPHQEGRRPDGAGGGSDRARADASTAS